MLVKQLWRIYTTCPLKTPWGLQCTSLLFVCHAWYMWYMKMQQSMFFFFKFIWQYQLVKTNGCEFDWHPYCLCTHCFFHSHTLKMNTSLHGFSSTCVGSFFKKKQRGGLAFLKRNSILDNKFCVEGSVSFLPLKLRFFFLKRRNREARVRISKKKYKFGQFLISVWVHERCVSTFLRGHGIDGAAFSLYREKYIKIKEDIFGKT